MSDGVLTVMQLRDLQLGVSRFAMLAACETGLHDLRQIPDEFLSLPVALNEAGVPGVVASLWPVPAGPTHAMVQGVFRRHIAGGLSPAAALRETQLALRGEGWRFPIGDHVLGFGTPASADAAIGGIVPADGLAPVDPQTPAPNLFSWAAFVCFGG